MTKATLVSLAFATVLRIILGYRQEDIWKIPGWKYLIYVPVMTLVGVLGAKFPGQLTQGDASSLRMYGTILAGIITVPVMASLLKVRTKNLFGYASLAAWIAIIATKAACILNGCCFGIILFNSAKYGLVRFPSAILETVVAVLLFIRFYVLANRKYPHELLYPLFMVYYGVYRYAADWFRGNPIERQPFFLWLPVGRFFCIIIFAIGITSLYFLSKKMLGRKPAGKEFLNLILGKPGNDILNASANTGKGMPDKKRK